VGFASWELDLWGRVRSLNEAALLNYLATDDGRRAVAVGLIAQVANGYLGLLELDERLELARRTVYSRAESLRIYRRRVELGATSKFELTQVESLWRQATILLAQLEQARAAQVHGLGLLVGAPVDTATTDGRVQGLTLFRELEPGTPSDLLLQRPDIVAAEHALKAANANIGAARGAFFPRIALTGSAGTASAELDGLFGSGSRAWAFAPSISLPIFDGGRLKAALQLAQVRREQSVVQYEKTVQSAFRDVADALSARRWFGEQAEILRATLAVQTERARLAKLRYDSGAARYLEVLDAERERLAVEQLLVQTERARLAAQVALYAALGGGSLRMNPVGNSGLGTP
jgi:multidrug efflux system outer membrane protein